MGEWIGIGWVPALWILAYFTLAFDSSPIKGEEEYGWFVLVHPLIPCQALGQAL